MRVCVFASVRACTCLYMSVWFAELWFQAAGLFEIGEREEKERGGGRGVEREREREREGGREREREREGGREGGIERERERGGGGDLINHLVPSTSNFTKRTAL